MNTLTREKRSAVIRCLADGYSIRMSTRMGGAWLRAPLRSSLGYRAKRSRNTASALYGTSRPPGSVRCGGQKDRESRFAVRYHPIEPAPEALINPACRADQPDGKLHLRLANANRASVQLARGQPLASSSLRLPNRRNSSARLPTNSPLEETPRKRAKSPVFQGPNAARADSLCSFASSKPIAIRRRLYQPKCLV